MFSKLFRESLKSDPLQKASVIFLLVVFGVVFTLRGPFRALTDSGINDLISPYVQTQAWLHGADPYASESLLRFWPTAAEEARPATQEIRDGSVLVRHGIPTAYPPTCFAVLSPFIGVPWPLFKVMWVSVTIVLFFATVGSLVSLARLDPQQRILFVLGSLLLAPFHTGIATCNIAIIAIELGLIAEWFAYTNRLFATGILIAICASLKPQIGLCFLTYYVVRGRWKISALAVTTILCIGLIAISRMGLAHVHWLASYELDNRVLLSTGVLGDFTERNPTRFGLVNLQVGVYPWMRSRVETNFCVLVFCVALFAFAVTLLRKFRVRNDLLCLSAICTLSLLPIYHRFYDAALLIVPLCWFVNCLKPTRNLHEHSFSLKELSVSTSSALGFLTLVVFFIPGGSLLETLRDKGAIPAALSGNAWWNALVMAHSAWCLVVLVLVLLYQMARRNDSETGAVV